MTVVVAEYDAKVRYPWLPGARPADFAKRIE